MVRLSLLLSVYPLLQHGNIRLQLTAPKAGENVSLLVAVRVRPVLKSEQLKNKDAQTKDILRVIDKRMVLVMDPEEPEEKDYLDQVQNRSKVGIWVKMIHVTVGGTL